MLLPHLKKQVVRASPRDIEAILCRQQGETPPAAPSGSSTADAPEGCWEKETLAAMADVTPGCVVLVTHVHDVAGSSPDGGDKKDEKKSKKDKKEKKDKKDKDKGKVSGDNGSGGSGGWSGVAGPGDLAVACWYGNGAKGKSLSVLATKAEGSHLLHQLRESMWK
jgi:hypothetical protein